MKFLAWQGASAPRHHIASVCTSHLQSQDHVSRMPDILKTFWSWQALQQYIYTTGSRQQIHFLVHHSDNKQQWSANLSMHWHYQRSSAKTVTQSKTIPVCVLVTAGRMSQMHKADTTLQTKDLRCTAEHAQASGFCLLSWQQLLGAMPVYKPYE